MLTTPREARAARTDPGYLALHHEPYHDHVVKALEPRGEEENVVLPQESRVATVPDPTETLGSATASETIPAASPFARSAGAAGPPVQRPSAGAHSLGRV